MIESIQKRQGLPGLRPKLLSQVCKIAYLGASVTAQKDGYRPRLHQWFVQHFERPHIALNAASGGVGSVSAVFTLEELVLRHRPELCLVEFSTGDTDSRKAPQRQLGPALEGMLRKLAGIRCQLCFLYLYRADHCFESLSEVLVEYEHIAEYYGVPSLNVGQIVEAQIRAGAYQAADLFKDVVHTTPLGSQLTADLIAQGLCALLAGADEPHSEECWTQRSPLYAGHYQHTRVVEATPALLKEQSNFTCGRFHLYYDYLQIDASNEFACCFDGELVGLMLIVGKESGVVEVTGPDGLREYCAWDAFCYYERYNTLLFDPPYPAGARVTIRLSDKPVDYSTCRRRLDDTHLIRKNLKVIGFMLRP